MRREEKKCEKGNTEEERETFSHSTLAVDSSWPLFFVSRIRKAGRLVDSDDKELVLLISGPGR
jgi:hypothetical protein